MMEQVRRSIEESNLVSNITVSFPIAIDTGKSHTKEIYQKVNENGQTVTVKKKFPSAIGFANEDTSADVVKPFRTSLLSNKGYYVGEADCDITPTEDNQKDGTGNTAGMENNHDREIVTLCACKAICDAMCDLGITQANVDVALGMPISIFSTCTNQREYFENILKIGVPITCDYPVKDSKTGKYSIKKLTFTVRKHKVCPETFSAFESTEAGICGENIVFVDIGGNNIQYITQSHGKVNYDPNKTRTETGGANVLLQNILDKMREDQLNPRPETRAELQTWLLNPRDIDFEVTDMWKEKFDRIVTDEKRSYFKEINKVFALDKGRFKDEMARGYKIIYTGGGAVLLKDEIRALSDANKKFNSLGGEFSNVIGFYKSVS